MIDFTTVSREIQSLLGRRRELLTLLGSIFAGLGIFLQNVLQGNLPPALQTLEEHIFAFVALVLMVTSLVLSLRMARLHAGMVYNGILYARLTQGATFPLRKKTPQRAAEHNFAGASFLQIVLMTLLAGFSTAVLVLALGGRGVLAIAAGAAVVLAWLGLHFTFHLGAARAALKRAREQELRPFDRNEWEAHTSASLEGTNLDLLAAIGFVGLMMFSSLETLSALGSIHLHAAADLPLDGIVKAGPSIYTGLMVAVCLIQAVIYVRLQVAQGLFSLDLDPTDRPFKPLKLTDSLLGYILLAFLLAVSVHLLLVALEPKRWEFEQLLKVDAAVVAAAVVVQQLVLTRAGLKSRLPG